MADDPNKIRINTLGHSGVILDQNPLEPGTPLDSLLNAQNATHDPRKGRGGAIVKRPGLLRFNSASADGVILGGIPMPVVGYGGAPATGGGGQTYDDGGIGDGVPLAPNDNPTEGTVGDPPGTGDKTGGPGGTFNNAPPKYGTPGAGVFTTTTKFSGARLVVLGRAGSTSSSGQGWYLGSRGWLNTPEALTTPGPPMNASTLRLGAGAIGLPGPMFGLDNDQQWTFYHKDNNDGSSNSTAHTIRKTNGASDLLVGTVAASAASGASSTRYGPLSLHYGTDNFLYLAYRDHQTLTGANARGRLLKVDPTTGAVTTLLFTTAKLPLSVHARFGSIGGSSRVFYGEYLGTQDSGAVIRVSDAAGTSFTADGGSGTVDFDAVTCFQEFNGRLFAGFHMNASAPGGNIIASRSPTTATTDSGAWHYDSGLSGIVNDKMFVVSMCLWRDACLYVSVFDFTNTDTYIYRVTATDVGNPEGTGFLFTQVFADTSASAVPLFLWHDPSDPNYASGYLYAVGTAGSIGDGGRVHVTTNGTTWTTRTALGAEGTGSYVGPVFIGMDQA